jgi:hypothetical protein
MILLSMRCSMTCAAQPEVREMTNSGVNIAVGTPIMWYDTAENQSRFGNIFLTSHITDSRRSAMSNIFIEPASCDSERATSLMTTLRGSEMV